MTKVYFIGAGPGDPELLTIKGKKIITQADLIIYTGSLVHYEIIEDHKEDALVFNSAVMTLEEIIELINKEKNNDKIIARVHTGDPCLYGAIREQMDKLEELNIDYTIIPGVSSFSAAASVLKKEYTLPGVSQTLICTRLAGRTPVPETEKLSGLASHTASMAIFLSIGMIDKVVQELLTAYKKETPCAIVYKATWPDQKVIQCKLFEAEKMVKKEKITKHALLLVGDFLGDKYELSKLYDKTFSHEYRKNQ